MENKTENTEQALKRLRAELNLFRRLRTERNRPTLWINRDSSRVEIHFEGKTILCDVRNIDKETPRKDSDRMAEGSGYKQVPFQNEEEQERANK